MNGATRPGSGAETVVFERSYCALARAPLRRRNGGDGDRDASVRNVERRLSGLHIGGGGGDIAGGDVKARLGGEAVVDRDFTRASCACALVSTACAETTPACADFTSSRARSRSACAC